MSDLSPNGASGRTLAVLCRSVSVREALTELCSPHFDVYNVGSDDELLAAASRRDVDLALVELTGMSSRDIGLCSEFRRRSHVPLVAMSERFSEVDVVVSLEVGADDFVMLPFRPRELLARLRAILRRPRVELSGSGPSLSGGDIVLDLTDRTVRVGSRETMLTSREFDVLRVLLDRPGRAVPRSELLTVLARQHDGGPINLDGCIRRLRVLIEADPNAQRRVEAVRGYGYRLDLGGTR